MEQIVIEVEDKLAVKWRSAAPDVKSKVTQEVERYLNQLLEKGGDDFRSFLDQVRAEAEARSFDDRVLKTIVAES